MERLALDGERLWRAWVTPWDGTAVGLDTPAVAMGLSLVLMDALWLAYAWGARRRRRPGR